ncbi:MAG: DUF3108 domain-containing protein [Anaerolineae bacterium]
MKSVTGTRFLSIFGTWLLVSGAIISLLAGCGAAATPTAGVSAAASPTVSTTVTAPATVAATGLGLQPAPWQDGSTASYDWLDASDSQVGTSQYSFALSEGTWTISETDRLPSLEQKIEMRIDATTLAPLGEQKTIQTASNSVEVTTQYTSGNLSIDATVDGQKRSASLGVPANAIDNDQVLMTLRALPFAQGYSVTYVAIVAQNALKVDTTFTVVSQESVTVPAGTFDTWRVEMASGPSVRP